MQIPSKEDLNVPEPPVFDRKSDEQPDIADFKIRPDLDTRFKPATVKEVIHNVLEENLSGRTYEEDTVEELIKSIASKVKNILEEEIFKRYKIVVNVVLGEQHGAGLSCAARCLWDHDTDSYASLSFVNDSLFCVCTVFGVYYY